MLRRSAYCNAGKEHQAQREAVHALRWQRLSLWVYPSGNRNRVVCLQKDGKRQNVRQPFEALSLVKARAFSRHKQGHFHACSPNAAPSLVVMLSAVSASA